MKNKIINLFIIALMTGLFSSCDEKNHYDAPAQAACVDPGLTKTKEVAQLWASAPTGSSPGATIVYSHVDVPGGPEIPDYIEGYVISSDEGGNFFKNMYIQPTDGSKGFNLSVDAYNLYTQDYQPGKKVFLKLNGLGYANPPDFARGLIFGDPPTDRFAVDRLASYKLKEHVIPSCDIISEDAIVHRITIAQAKSSDVYLNTLVELTDVQFASDSGTYDSNTTDDFDSSVDITDGVNTMVIRTSRFANFAGYKFPNGRGTIRGVLTKYGSGSNPYQIILRTERDVNLPNQRIDFATPIVGSAIVFSGAFTEDFESYSTTSPANRTFPKYINDPVLGSRYWGATTFSNNKYIQMTSFGGSAENNRSLFFLPVDFTAANTFSFQSKSGFTNGNVLKVYYILASDYTQGGIVDNTKLVDITSSFTISPGLSSGYPTNFTNSGNYAIPAGLTGNGYFIFEYVGSGITGLTSTMQIDNVIVN